MKFLTGGSNSAGRVRPCQGRCRGFESRLPLHSIGLPIAMTKTLLFFTFSALAFAQYKLEPVTTAAPGLPAGYAAVIDSNGYRVVGPAGAWCEVWLRKSIPHAAKP